MPFHAARIAVIVASKGRSETLRQMIPYINAQTLLPASFLLSVTAPSDADFDLEDVLNPRISGRKIIASPGTCSQRNAALDQVGPDIDYVVFYDDDFFPSIHSLEALVIGFAHHSDVDGITGKLLADGIGGPGLTAEEARVMLEDWDARAAVLKCEPPRITRDTFGLYGCNMACRASAIDGLRFDENLPAYGWQEDVDFACRMRGRRVEMEAFTGVHLGTKSGREITGRRFGYSQVINPYYLWRKGTLSTRFALTLVSRNFAANHLKAFRPEPWVDRRGRLLGNWQGVRDILRGRANPDRIQTLNAARL